MFTNNNESHISFVSSLEEPKEIELRTFLPKNDVIPAQGLESSLSLIFFFFSIKKRIELNMPLMIFWLSSFYYEFLCIQIQSILCK